MPFAVDPLSSHMKSLLWACLIYLTCTRFWNITIDIIIRTGLIILRNSPVCFYHSETKYFFSPDSTESALYRSRKNVPHKPREIQHTAPKMHLVLAPITDCPRHFEVPQIRGNLNIWFRLANCGNYRVGSASNTTTLSTAAHSHLYSVLPVRHGMKRLRSSSRFIVMSIITGACHAYS